MKRVLSTLLLIGALLNASHALAQTTLSASVSHKANGGTLTLTPLASNAVRVQFAKDTKFQLPDDWIYPDAKEQAATDIQVEMVSGGDAPKLRFCDKHGRLITEVLTHELIPTKVQDREAYAARITLCSPTDEYITGLGQFQDGLSNLRGVSRRLTQVNTQISIPMMISSKGYGLLWNNYGMVEYNPSDKSVKMLRSGEEGSIEVVDVTSTEGSKQEVRQSNLFRAVLEIEEDGEYGILLDVGQAMARRHNIAIDGKTIVEVNNLWLPPTTSVQVNLKKGRHIITSELNNEDSPTIYYRKVDNTTTLSSPVADKVDYTLFVGSPDEIIAAYRNLTGNSPMMPKWALGYIHCRERFHSSAEILENAYTFREKQLPVDVIVQDWQWWGKHGWNAMTFDEDNYPDPSALTKELHEKLNMRLMLSVWSKIDDSSPLGKEMKAKGYYIPGTTWIDFFNPKAAAEYWKNFSQRLLVHNIDAWWQDATEPENDDLAGRLVANGMLAGEQVRNVYPLLVSKTVYDGLRKDDPQRRAMILTRSGFPGIQRYGSTLWSGDVGNDWETLRRQIIGGLGLMSAGHPWWTYDAGGFFRPWKEQYQDKDYIERMLRWIETATFLPLMRIHGYMSDTEPWRYGDEAEAIIKEQLELRYRLLPYIYTEAAEVSRNGSTMMRPLVFDFANDAEALKHDTQYMFGRAILVNPILASGVKTYKTYLPKHSAGWYDFYTGRHYDGGQSVETEATLNRIPVFVKAGSIIPIGPVKQFAMEETTQPLELRIYSGADCQYTLYDDEGDNYNCENGAFALTTFSWNNKTKKLKVGKTKGKFKGMKKATFKTRIY